MRFFFLFCFFPPLGLLAVLPTPQFDCFEAFQKLHFCSPTPLFLVMLLILLEVGLILGWPKKKNMYFPLYVPPVGRIITQRLNTVSFNGLLEKVFRVQKSYICVFLLLLMLQSGNRKVLFLYEHALVCSWIVSQTLQQGSLWLFFLFFCRELQDVEMLFWKKFILLNKK